MKLPGARMRGLLFIVLLACCWGGAARACATSVANAASELVLPPEGSAFPLGSNPRRVWIEPALLANFYEHMNEHAPPRQSGGVMQHRERYYRAPAEPFTFLQSKLTSSVADQQFASDLARLHATWTEGRERESVQTASLRADAIASSVPAESLLDAARAMQWLISEDTAQRFFAAGLEKAVQELNRTTLEDSRRKWLLHTIDQTACLWRGGDQEALVARFTIARNLNPRLSIESRRAGYLLAEALLATEHRKEAAELILEVQREHIEVGDLPLLDASNIPEMNFVTGFILFQARRYGEAIEYLSRIEGEHLSVANTLLFEAYLQTHRFDAARSMIPAGAVATANPLGPDQPLNRLNEELNHARWVLEVGSLDIQPPTSHRRNNEK